MIDQGQIERRARQSRDLAYAARRAQRVIMGMRATPQDPERALYARAADCGRALRGGPDVDIDWHDGKRLAAMPGASCEWPGCPVCGRSIRARKASEITLMAAEWERRGGQLIMLTLAPPHHRGDDLDATWAKLEAVWKLTSSDRVGMRWRHRWRIRGHAVSIEATVGGAHGDHPHRHALLFIERAEGDPWVDPDDLAGDLLASLVRWRGNVPAERGACLAGWGMAGVQAIAAGPGAGRYLAKLDGDDWDDLLGLGAEMSDAGTAKLGRGTAGGVSITAVCALIALQWQRETGRQRMTRAWLVADPRRRQLIGALHAWKRLTRGKPLISITRGLLRELVPDASQLSDEEIVGRARKLKEEEDRLKAEARGEPPAVVAPLTPAEEDWQRPFSVASDLWAAAEEAWGDEWGGPEVAVCRMLERAGPWRAVEVLASLAWERGWRPKAWVHSAHGRLRVGCEDEWWGDPALPEPDTEWAEMTWADVALRSDRRSVA